MKVRHDSSRQSALWYELYTCFWQKGKFNLVCMELETAKKGKFQPADRTGVQIKISNFLGSFSPPFPPFAEVTSAHFNGRLQRLEDIEVVRVTSDFSLGAFSREKALHGE